VVCTESAENWHVKGLSFNFSVDEDGCSSEGSTDASTSSPRFLMNGDKVKQKPPLQSDGFTSEESTDTLTDRPRFFMDSGLMKQILADGLDGAESTDTSTCSPDLMMDVDMAQQMRFIQLAESVCQVRDLVGYACGFLRMDRSRILVDTNEKCRRRGSVALIRMYVHHLPFAKRADGAHRCCCQSVPCFNGTDALPKSKVMSCLHNLEVEPWRVLTLWLHAMTKLLTHNQPTRYDCQKITKKLIC